MLVTLGRLRDALPYVREKVEIFERTGEQALEIEGRQRLAEIYEEELHDYAAATTQWHKVRALRSGSDDVAGELEAAESLARLARLSSSDANTVITYHQDALELACKLDDAGKQGDMLNTLGILHWQQKDYAQSLSCYERALEIFRERADQVHVGLVLNSIGAVLRDSDRLEDALDQLREALDTNRQSGQRRLESHSLATLGDVSAAPRLESPDRHLCNTRRRSNYVEHLEIGMVRGGCCFAWRRSRRAKVGEIALLTWWARLVGLLKSVATPSSRRRARNYRMGRWHPLPSWLP